MKNILKSFSDLKGCTLRKILVLDGDEQIFFTLDSGDVYALEGPVGHFSSVTLEDTCGELVDLIDTPILLAEEISTNSETIYDDNNDDEYHVTSWTYYKLATIKGSVTFRWYESSLCRYAEKVEWKEVNLNCSKEDLVDIRIETERKTILREQDNLNKVKLDCWRTSYFLKKLPSEVFDKKTFFHLNNYIPICYMSKSDPKLAIKCPLLSTITLPNKVLSKCMYLDEYVSLDNNEHMSRCPFNIIEGIL